MIDNDFATFKLILEPVLREELVVGRKYCSPISRNGHFETGPSFSVFEGAGKYEGYLYWKDWGITDKVGARPVDLIMRLHNVDKEMAEEMLDKLEMPEVVEYKRQKKNNLRIEDRSKLDKRELKWWSEYNVGEELLEEFDVYGVDALKSGQFVLYSKETGNVAFSYRGGDDLEQWQFYQPDPKTFWRYRNFIYGWNQLPYIMDDLLIVSGMKDGMCTVEASGLPFLAGSGEGAYKQFQKLMPILKRRAKRIWTLLDPDFPGVTGTAAFKQEVDIPPFPFHYVNQTEDIADLSKKYGMKWLTNRFHEALNRI